MQRDPRLALADFVLMSLPQAVLMLDAEGRVIESNRAACRRVEIMQLFAPSPIKDERVLEFLADLRAHGTATAEISLPSGPSHLDGVCHDGFFIVLVHDVSERRELDEELQLLRSGASLALVAATLVHDFNNLLTPVLLLSSRLANEVEKESRVAMIASEIHDAATLGASLMRDVLSLSRPRTNVIERVDVNEVVVERLGLIQRLLGDSVAVVHMLDAQLGDVLVDRKRFEHALLNLVANARDAMPDGGRLILTTHLAESKEGPFVTLSVTDTGVGMTDNVRRRAFDSFFTTKADAGGRGIGLASVHRFARESGGHVTLESEPMKGTTATLALPRLAASEPVEAQPVDRVEVASGTATVLVADSNDAVRRAIAIALEARGYTVLAASSADTALELAAEHQPEIALVDTQLARHDHRTFLHRLRAASGQVHIVFLSVAPWAGAKPSDFEISFLPKAFSDEELVRAVGEALACSG
jgi:signal transduction histidine kinase